jgi:hypothetical protein
MTGLVFTLFVLGILTVLNAFTGAYAPFGIYYPAANVFLLILMFAGLSGLWSMEKWGLWLFLVFVVLKLILDIWTGAFHYAELLLVASAIVFFIKRSGLT